MVDTVASKFSGVPIKAVIGGFHLISSPPFNAMAGSRHEVEALGKSVINYPVEMTYSGHCTGAKAFAVLKAVIRITSYNVCYTKLLRLPLPLNSS